jgi:riboflavin biosynthesis pyrimidine reductase
MRQLFPIPVDDVDALDVYGDIPVGGARPWVRLNMIASVDGATSVEGLSGQLGGPSDHKVFAALRSLTDAVLVAAGTVRAERYGPVRFADATVDARRARGQADVPPIAVISRTCALDWSTPFFTDATARPIVVTVESAPVDNRRQAADVADVVVVGDKDVDLAGAVDALGQRGAGNILAEGGPTLNGHLAAAGMLDELCLTLSPRLVGGDAHRIVHGPALTGRHDVDLRSICEEDGYLFLRFRTRP